MVIEIKVVAPMFSKIIRMKTTKSPIRNLILLQIVSEEEQMI